MVAALNYLSASDEAAIVLARVPAMAAQQDLLLQMVALADLTRKGFAEGGSVSYDPNQVDEIINGISAPRNYAEGGSVTAYDPSRVDAIVNQFM